MNTPKTNTRREILNDLPKQKTKKELTQQNMDKINTLHGSLGAYDVQGDTVVCTMGSSQSVSGHGIRYSREYAVFHNGKSRKSGIYTIRGATASETDHRELDFNQIHILDISGDEVVFAMQSHQLLRIQKFDAKTARLATLEAYNLAQEQREKEKEELAKTLEQSNWKDNLKTAKDLIGKNYNYNTDFHDVQNPIIFDEYAIIPVAKSNRNYDAEVRKIDFWIIGNKYPNPTKIDSMYCDYRSYSGRFYTIRANCDADQISPDTIQMHIKYRRSGANHSYDYDTQTKTITIK